MSPVAGPVRVAVVGFGVRGQQWGDACAAVPQVELAAVVDVRPVGVGADVPVFATLREAASVGLDAVVLSTPPEAHRADVEVAADLGLAVLCEKPLSESLDEAVRMVAVARDRSVPLLVGMNFRFLPVVVALRGEIAGRELGAPMYATMTYLRNRDGTRPDLNDHPLTMAQPMLLEQSIHHLDLLRYVYDREVLSVAAETWNPPTSVYRDDACVSAHLVMEGDLHVTYVGTWVSGTNRLSFSWRTDLERGVLTQSRQFGDLSAGRRIAGAERGGPRFDEDAEPLEPIPLPEATPFVEDTEALLRQLCAAARGEAAADPSGADHLRTLALVHACIASAEERRTIDVAAFASAWGI